MVFFNYALRKLNAKIVYYGPGLCGKTTNLMWIHDHFEGGDRGKMISLATEGDRTIFFDLLPLEIGSIRGMDVTLQLYTVPGQVHYNSTRQLVLRGADGVVFVADSQRALQSSNIESFRNLQENLLLQGIGLEGFPLALQFNKRDLKDVIPVEELDSDLNVFRVPIFEAVATDGVGVQETLEGIVKLVMRSLRKRYEGAAADARSPGAADPAATMRAPLKATPPTGVSAPAPAPAPAVTPPPTAGEPPPVEPLAPPRSKVPPPAAAAPPDPAPPVQPVTPPAASVPPPVVVPEPAVPVAPPDDEIVFPDDDPARTRDFSKDPGPLSGGEPSGGGFEDEVSTAVYDVGDEIDVAPAGLGDSSSDGDVFTSAEDRAFVDEVTKSEVSETVEPPPTDWDLPTEPVAAEEPVAVDEEPEIEFVTDDAGGDAPPPTADLPPPEERYVDRIVAPSPFAPRDQGEDPDAKFEEILAAEDDVLEVDENDLVFGDAGDQAGIAALDADIVVDESSDHAIEVPVEEIDYEEVQLSTEQPFVVGDGDPFAESEPEPEPEPESEPEPAEPGAPPAAIETAQPRAVAVRAEDNQLHMRLQGTGAIIESGQVRELDIEVPVPGSWVGNRRVTLQLRLTLTPDSEDENGGSGETP